MTRLRRLAVLFLPILCLLLPACSGTEPINGCVLAAANRRELLRAKNYLHAAIPARIAGVYFLGLRGAHAVLVYRLDDGWWAYDDVCASRPLHLGNGTAFPEPVAAATAAFPGHPIFFARWIDPDIRPAPARVDSAAIP